MAHRNLLSPRALQEYLEALARSADAPDSRSRTLDLLRSYAEICFQVRGGSNCALCHAHVRHVLSVISERPNGETREFPCLCTRCFESERSVARHITLCLGNTSVEYPCKESGVASESIPQQIPHPRGMGF